MNADLVTMLSGLIWKRFWTPRATALSFLDSGFLFDPDSEYGPQLCPGVCPTGQLDDVPCLALLGEPGMGKSIAISQGFKSADPDSVLAIDLKEYGDESRLIRDLFECDQFARWREGQAILRLFIDALDECRLRIPHVANIIAGGLTKLGSHLSRLRFRIACRTSDWPNGLDAVLQQLWPDGRYGAYELLPHRQRDVSAAAKAFGIDEHDFLEEVQRMRAQPLAAKPVTLGLLLHVFRKDGRLPTSQVDLYDQGCLLLCEETNPSRRDAGQTGTLSASHRLCIAQRIAALTIFCGKVAVRTDVLPAKDATDDLAVRDIAGGDELLGHDRIRVDEKAVHEVLGTGLFNGRGPGRMSFAHKTFAEYLAATFLTRQEMDAKQILSVVSTIHNGHAQIVPQLGETTGWLSSLRRELFDAILDSDPQILLQGDVAKSGDSSKEAIVKALLAGFAKGTIDDSDWGLISEYHKLCHPNLPAQIRPSIMARDLPRLVQRFAFDLAEECKLVELTDSITSIALDPTRPLWLREKATHAVVAGNDRSATRRLIPLLDSPAELDPNDELLGLALRALWPDILSIADVFEHIRPKRNDHYIGKYHSFLVRELAPNLRPPDLPFALEWAALQENLYAAGPLIRDLVESILRMRYCNKLWLGFFLGGGFFGLDS